MLLRLFIELCAEALTARPTPSILLCFRSKGRLGVVSLSNLFEAAATQKAHAEIQPQQPHVAPVCTDPLR